jgi:alpha-tubulin suppressor-like RCC1 family protein
MALKDDGTVVSWGLNEFYWETPVPAGLTGVTAIAGGGGHSLALKSDGSVYGWGGNDSGQVTGTRTTTPETNYVTLDGRLLGDVIAIAAGIESSIALRKDGSVVCWGRNDFGQSTAPGAAQSNVIAIAAGEVHSVALRADGTVLAWGNNNFGQVTGSPNLEVPYFGTASPVTLEGHQVNGVTAIAAGGLHTVALLGTVTALQATRSGNNLVLTWPTQPAGFKLQSTSSLTPPVAWIDSSASPTNGNVTNLIKLQGGEFFRLRKP